MKNSRSNRMIGLALAASLMLALTQGQAQAFDGTGPTLQKANKVQQVEDVAASLAVATASVPSTEQVGRVGVGLGVAVHNDTKSLAAGLSYKPTQSSILRLGTGVTRGASSNKVLSAGAGLTF